MVVDVVPVDDRQRVHRRSAGTVGSPKRSSTPRRWAVGRSARRGSRWRIVNHSAHSTTTEVAVVAEQQAARALVEPDDEHDRAADRHQHVRQRRERVRLQPLLDPEQSVGELEVRERPHAEHRDQEDRHVAVAEDERAEGRAQRGEDRGGDRGRDEQEADRAAGEGVAMSLVTSIEVEAQERLDDPETDEDADEDAPLASSSTSP